MKKTLLTIAVLSSSAFAFGQVRADRAKPNKADATQPGDTQFIVREHTPRADRGTTFWSEDFSGGFPAGWSTTDIGTLAGEPPVTFVWTSDPNAVNAAANNNQFNGIDFRLFQSTTASNGYLWANSDRNLPSPGPTQEHIAQLTTSAINCSGQTTVLLAFQSTIGVFDLDANTNALVQVSTDGVNWTDYQPHPCLIADSPNPPCARWSNNPDFVELDISPTASNQPVVYIRWQWTGLWEYYWAIDDIELTAVPPYERQMTFSYVSHLPLSEGYEYGRIPVNHLNSVKVAAEVRNRGTIDQTGMTITAAATSPTAFSANQSFATVVYNDTVLMEQDAAISNPGFGTYNVNFTLSSNEDAQEGNPSDDSITRQFAVSNDRYGLDGVGVYANNALTSLGSNSFTNNNTGLTVMNFFPVSQPITVLGLEMLITSTSTANSYVSGALRDTAGVIGVIPLAALPPSGLLTESSFIDITAAHIAAGSIFIPFDQPYVINSPRDIFACVTMNGTATEIIRVVDDNTVGQPAWASMIHLANSPAAGTPARAWSNGNAFAIRLVLAPIIVSVPELDAQGVTLAPNPTTGLLNFYSEKPGNYSIEVLNLIGERVMTERTNGNATLNLSSLAKGVYMVRVSNGDRTGVQRIVLE